ncbi:TRAP transporter small permease subunit [uncultured Oscillibacter sp.]|uniref:TRAP transporter small permease n=1 Tax=uncultured Oscillibacter sp. TaxID=876091 RepID=UPI0028056ABC|nr:TRAP transporter small permease subunit [uncultured Oscillibacter sp.]
MRWIYDVRRIIDKVLPAIASVFFTVGMISAFLGAVTRTFTTSSGFVWVDEVTRFSMIWATMLVVGICMRKKQMTEFTLIIDKLPHKGKVVFDMVIQIIVLLFYGIIFCYGLRLSLSNADLSCTTLPFSMMYVYMIWPISAGLLIYEGITCLIEMTFDLVGKPLHDESLKKEA